MYKINSFYYTKKKNLTFHTATRIVLEILSFCLFAERKIGGDSLVRVVVYCFKVLVFSELPNFFYSTKFSTNFLRYASNNLDLE